MTKTQELKNYTFICVSDIGNEREENEDAYAQFDTVNGSFFILCDGMGGLAGGKEAAEQTIVEIEKFVNEEWEDEPIKLIEEAIKQANKNVFDYFQNTKDGVPGGTTLVLVLIRNNKIYYAHVGDSRIYYQTGKKLFLLTKDHSFVMEMVEKKLMSEEDARKDIRRSQITRAIGIKKDVEPTICTEPINPADNDYLLLCSDGLTGELKDKELLSIILSSKETKEKGNLLIKRALKKGGVDNITLQLIRFYNTGRDRNTEFLSNQQNKKKKRIMFMLMGLFFLTLISLFVLINPGRHKEKTIVKPALKSKTSLLISKYNTKGTIVKLFIKKDDRISEYIEQYYSEKDLVISKIKLSGNKNNTMYLFPINAVYINRVGRIIYAYPGIEKENIIDILILNNKKELYFKPGEKIIVPQIKQTKW